MDYKKRQALKAGVVSVAALSSVALLFKDEKTKVASESSKQPDSSYNVELLNDVSPSPAVGVDKNQAEQELAVKDNLDKSKDFNKNFIEDIFLAEEKKPIFKSSLQRILRVQKTIGYANFNLVSFDDMLLYAHRYPKIGTFTREELALIDELFFFDAHKYGFYGDKVITNITSKINKKETIKISRSGHYIFQGDALVKYKQLKKDVGPDLVLTSGVRGIVKQLQLFLAKLDSSQGNLSMASRSLAPPGHSYHGIGDFDVGKKGFGKFNFTSKFASTNEYKKLIELKYIDLRYTQDNKIGVRYEPWHIKVV